MAETLRKVTKEKQAWKRVGSQEKKQDRGWRRAPVSSASDAIQERRDRAQDRPLLIPAGQGEQEGQAGENGSPCSGSGLQLSAGSSTPLWKSPSTSQTPSVPVRLLNTPLPSAALHPPPLALVHTQPLCTQPPHTCVQMGLTQCLSVSHSPPWRAHHERATLALAIYGTCPSISLSYLVSPRPCLAQSVTADCPFCSYAPWVSLGLTLSFCLFFKMQTRIHLPALGPSSPQHTGKNDPVLQTL